MFRVRIALVAALAIVLVTVGALVFVSMALSERLTADVEGIAERAQAAQHRALRLEAVELTTTVASLAREDEFVKIFAAPSEDERRRAAHAAVEVRQVRLEKQYGRKAAIVAVIDKDGKVVARDLNINALYGEDLKSKYPSVAMALQGTANKDEWSFEKQMYRVGAAPIHDAAGRTVGALVVGYVESAADAQAARERLGTEVAFFLDGKIHASSFQQAEGQSSESAEEKQLAEQLFGGPKPLADQVTEGHQGTHMFRVRIAGVDYVGAAAPMPGNATRSRSGFVVLASLSGARDAEAPVSTALLLVGLVGVLAALGAATFTARRFLGPLDRIEAGVSEVINGNHDYEFESPSPDYEGLAEQLNVMIARLLGRPDPGDEDGTESDGGGMNLDEQSGSTAPASASASSASASAESEALASEPAEAYYQRVWSEYTAAREQTGEGTDGLSVEQFIAKLKQNEVALAKKYGARLVRFKVVVKSNQATLKPVPIQ